MYVLHNTATKMDVVKCSRRPFRAPVSKGATQGSAVGFTLGDIPAAAARLKESRFFRAYDVRRHLDGATTRSRKAAA